LAIACGPRGYGEIPGATASIVDLTLAITGSSWPLRGRSRVRTIVVGGKGGMLSS